MTFPKGCFYGGHDVPLSALGEAEARAAADVLKDEPIDFVFSSPLKRALYGAVQVGNQHSLEPIQDPNFKEVDRGRWLGLTKEQITEKFPGDLEAFAGDPNFNGHGGENYNQLSARVWDGFRTALKTAREKKARSIALVSHMWVTKSIITGVMGIQPVEQDKWAEVNIPTASISVLDFSKETGEDAEVVAVGNKPVLLEGKAEQEVLWGG